MEKIKGSREQGAGLEEAEGQRGRGAEEAEGQRGRGAEGLQERNAFCSEIAPLLRNSSPAPLSLLPAPSLLTFVVAVAMFWLCGSVVALADDEKSPPDKFNNPLEITTPDPLLPRQKVDRPLSPLESDKLRAALDELNAKAQAQLNAGDRAGAFAIWNRELRLRRALGSLAEVEALGRVGAIAWSENQSTEVQVITQRLQEIQLEAMPPKTKSKPVVDLQLLQALGQAYQQVRSPNLALKVYQQILAVQRQQQDSAAVEATLRTMAELNLSWFEYPAAAADYEQLLGVARTQGDRVSELLYLQQLAYIYQKSKQHQQAVKIQQQLVERYLNENQVDLVPALRIAIASDYEALGQLQEAFENYQEAYQSAWSLQQYDQASVALRKLIALYRRAGQTDAALPTLQILLQADQFASNFYGLMDTYDQLGQIYLKRRNYPEALAAFQKGLEFAQQLKYRQNYFNKRIGQVSQLMSKQTS